MINNIKYTIEKYNMISHNNHIILGLSGGADSVSLLYSLIELKNIYNLRITAVHINHNLRGEESQRDESFVIKLCKTLNINYKVFSYDVLEKSKELKLSIEEAGRRLRYETFEQVRKEEKADKIAVAHNQNDQAETLIMNFFRGSGLKGLGGIPPVRDNIIRPLIGCRRDIIEEFCLTNDISYIIDSTNNSLEYTRNKVRSKLLPYVQKELNSNIIDTLVRSSEIFISEDKYINNQSTIAYNECVTTNKDRKELNIPKFISLDEVIQRRIIRIIFTSFCPSLLNFTNEHINMVVSLTKKVTGKSVSLPYGIKAEKSYECLIIHKPKQHSGYLYNIKLGSFIYIKELNIYVSINHNELIKKSGFTNKCTRVFNYDKINSNIVLRNRRPGDRIYIKSIGNKKIKDFFIDKKISRQERDLIPIILDDNNAMWIITDFFTSHKQVVSEYYKANEFDLNKIYIQIWEEANEK